MGTPAPPTVDAHGMLLDLKGIGRPSIFSGAEEAWSEWRFMFENWCALLGETEAMMVAARGQPVNGPTLATLGPDAVVASKTLYHVLCLHTRGRALATVRLSERYNGLMAWVLLTKEYEPAESADRMTAMLSGLLSPSQWQGMPCNLQLEMSIQQWERLISEYKLTVGQDFPDSLKLATIRKHLPAETQGVLRVTPSAVRAS